MRRSPASLLLLRARAPRAPTSAVSTLRSATSDATCSCSSSSHAGLVLRSQTSSSSSAARAAIHPALLTRRDFATARNGGGINRSSNSTQKQSLPTDEFDELKQFLMEPATEGDAMLRAKKIVQTMMQQHVFASMPGQEATVMVMVADAMEDYAFVIDVYACLRDARVSPSPLTLELTALACAELGDWKTATEVVEFMHQAIDVMHPSSDIYENAIVACYRADKWMKAKQFLDEMQSYGLEASPEIHLQCISLCIASNELTATKKLLSKYLHTFELEPEEVEESLGELYKQAIAAKSLDHALFFRDELLQYGFAFEKQACADLVQLCAVQRKWHRARVLLSQFHGEASSPSASRSSQYTRDIRKLLDDMARYNFDVSLPIYNAALRNYGQLGKNEDASVVFAAMKQNGVEPDVVSYAAAMAACGTNVSESEHLFREMESREGLTPSLDAYHAYLLAPSRATQWQQVLDRYSAITSTSSSVKQQIDQDARILSLVAVAYGRMKQHQNMLQVFTNMKVRGLRPNLYVYGEAMYAYIHLNQWRHALLLFDHIRQEGFEARKLADFAMIWDAAVLAAVNGEQVERAASLYDSIVGLRAKISPHTAVLLVDLLQDVPIATLWGSFRKMEHLHVVRKKSSLTSNKKKNNPRVLNAVLKRAVDERDVYFAEKLVDDAEDELEILFNSMTYSLMLRLYADKENQESFHLWCEKMAQANVKSTVFTFRAVLQHLKTLAEGNCEDPSYLQSINQLLELNLDDESEIRQVDRIGRHILDTMERRGMAPDALCFEYFLRLSSDPQHAARVLSVLESMDGFHFSSNFLHALFVTLGGHPERARVRDFLLKCVEDLPRGLSDDALAAYCSSSDADSALELLEALVSSDYELVDDQVVLFLVSVAPASEEEDESAPVVWKSDSNGRLRRLATLLIDTEAPLESGSMAFLIQQIVEVSKFQQRGAVECTSGIEGDLEAMRELLAYALSSYSPDQVHEFLSQVVQQDDFVHIESVLSALEN